MSYTVTQRTLGAVPGWHGGTGAWQDFKWLVDPSSVPPPGNLAFVQKTVGWNTLLFEIADNVVPNWFGVAIPEGITDFANPHIFFHPTPGQAGYNDGDYPTKTGQWPQLFHYADELGSQVAGAGRNQVVIFPFLTEAAKDTGIFPANWLDIVTQILTQVRDTTAPGSSGQVTVSQVAASSFSAGMIYLHAFVTTATGLAPLLAEAWDFDGHFSTYRWLSDPMPTWAKVRCIQYDQVVANDLARFHVPLPRWADYVNKPTSNMQVHSLIPAFMFMHGATITGVGGTIGEPGTHTASASHSATVSHSATGSGSVSHTATGSGSASHSASASASHSATASASHSASASASHSATASASHTASASASHTASASVSHSASPPPPPAPPPHPVPLPVPVVPPPRPARVPIVVVPPVAPVAPRPPITVAPPPVSTPPVPTQPPYQPATPPTAVRCPPAPCSDPCTTATTAVVASASTVAQVAATAIAAMAARHAATHKKTKEAQP